MSYSSDEFDAEIRGVLYNLRDKIDDDLSGDAQVKFLRSSVEAAISQADDYRATLLDREDEAEEVFIRNQEKDDLGDAKFEEERERRRGL